MQEEYIKILGSVYAESLVPIGDEKMTNFEKLVNWLRKIFRLYEKEIKQFADNMLELAIANLDEVKREKITPAIRKKIRNKVLADILVMGIDVAENKGKSATGRIIVDAIDWFISEGE